MPRAGTCARAHRPDQAAPGRAPDKCRGPAVPQDRLSPGIGSSNQQSVVSSSCHADTPLIGGRPDAERGRRLDLRLRPRPGGRPRLFGLIARLFQISRCPRPPSEIQLPATQPALPPASSSPASSSRPLVHPRLAHAMRMPGPGFRPGAARSSSDALASRGSPVTELRAAQPQRCNIVAVLSATMSHCCGYSRGRAAAVPRRRGKDEHHGTSGA